MAEIKSESTKEMTQEEIKSLREKVAKMTPEELREFRSSHNADEMGFWGEESV